MQNHWKLCDLHENIYNRSMKAVPADGLARLGAMASAGPVVTYIASHKYMVPDSKVHGANMGPIWGRQDPGGPHVGLVNFAIWGTPVFNEAIGIQFTRLW